MRPCRPKTLDFEDAKKKRVLKDNLEVPIKIVESEDWGFFFSKDWELFRIRIPQRPSKTSTGYFVRTWAKTASNKLLKTGKIAIESSEFEKLVSRSKDVKEEGGDLKNVLKHDRKINRCSKLLNAKNLSINSEEMAGASLKSQKFRYSSKFRNSRWQTWSSCLTASLWN